jgi:hypothetical protein
MMSDSELLLVWHCIKVDVTYFLRFGDFTTVLLFLGNEEIIESPRAVFGPSISELQERSIETYRERDLTLPNPWTLLNMIAAFIPSSTLSNSVLNPNFRSS